MIVPDCVTAVGRDAANRVRPLRTAPNVREVLPGMPASISVASPTAGGGTRHHNALLRTEDHLDAIWPVEVPAELVGPGWRRVDLDRWHTELDEREANLG